PRSRGARPSAVAAPGSQPLRAAAQRGGFAADWAARSTVIRRTEFLAHDEFKFPSNVSSASLQYPSRRYACRTPLNSTDSDGDKRSQPDCPRRLAEEARAPWTSSPSSGPNRRDQNERRPAAAANRRSRLRQNFPE